MGGCEPNPSLLCRQHHLTLLLPAPGNWGPLGAEDALETAVCGQEEHTHLTLSCWTGLVEEKPNTLVCPRLGMHWPCQTPGKPTLGSGRSPPSMWVPV